MAQRPKTNGFGLQTRRVEVGLLVVTVNGLHRTNRARVTANDHGVGRSAEVVEANAAQEVPIGNSRHREEGIVTSDKMDKTVVVAIQDRVKHGLYGKVLSRSHKLKAHDESNSAGIGDRVLLMETRPLSATKRWRVVQILEKAK